jgi:hypothetical protein
VEITIEHQKYGSRGAFFVQEEGKILAEMTYSRAGPSRFIIDHTAVSDALGGQGVGKRLVAAAVAMAREEGQRIIPLCPFARSVFEQTPEYADVWDR